MSSHLLIVDLSAGAIDDTFRNVSPVQRSSRIFLNFCSIRLSIYEFMLRSLVQLNLGLCRRINMNLFVFYNMQTSSQTRTIFEDVLSFSLYALAFFFQKSSESRWIGLFLGLQFDSVHQSAFFYTYTVRLVYLLFCMQYSLNSGMLIPPEFLLRFKIVLDILGFLFSIERKNHSFKIWKELCWNFDGNCIKSVNCFS